jgi:Ring finger domain
MNLETMGVFRFDVNVNLMDMLNIQNDSLEDIESIMIQMVMTAGSTGFEHDNDYDYDDFGFSGLTAREIETCTNQTIISAPMDCNICLDTLLPGSCVRRLSCKHSFCNDCISTWLNKHRTCPICKKDVCGENASRATEVKHQRV